MLVDESTDTSTKEQLAIYVRFCDVTDEEITTRYLSLEMIEGSPNAENIFNAIKAQFEQDSLPTSTLISQTSDAASVMISEKNDVAAKMKEEYN